MSKLSPPPSATTGGPRTFVVVLVLLVCLAAIYFSFTLRKSAGPPPEMSRQSPGSRVTVSYEDPATSRHQRTPKAFAPRRSRSLSALPQDENLSTPAGTAPDADAFSSLSLVGSAAVAPAGGIALPPASGFEISGRVRLVGTPPPETAIDMSSDPICASRRPARTTTRHYVVDKNGGLANVFVYIKSGLGGMSFPVPTNMPAMGWTNCMLEPYVLGVQANQRFILKNSDATVHNAHIIPPPGSGEKERNLALPKKDDSIALSFPASEMSIPIRIKCDVHPWEFGYISVFEHPFIAVTREDGTYHLPVNLPAGSYTIEAFHLKAGRTTSVVPAGAKKTVDFTLRVPESR